MNRLGIMGIKLVTNAFVKPYIGDLMDLNIFNMLPEGASLEKRTPIYKIFRNSFFTFTVAEVEAVVAENVSYYKLVYHKLINYESHSKGGSLRIIVECFSVDNKSLGIYNMVCNPKQVVRPVTFG